MPEVTQIRFIPDETVMFENMSQDRDVETETTTFTLHNVMIKLSQLLTVGGIVVNSLMGMISATERAKYLL